MAKHRVQLKKALITGASSGIGEALAVLLNSKGIKLILCGRNGSALEKIAQKTGAEKILVADLNDRKERLRIVSEILLELPDLIINNAGFGIYGDILSTAYEDQESIVQVNSLAPLEITIESARAWLAVKKKGIVVNVSSLGGDHPTPGMAVYGASKSFLTSFSLAANFELSPKGIHVLAACPGMVKTNFADRAAKKKVENQKHMMAPEFVAKEIWKQIEKKEPKRIIGGYYRFGSWIAKHFAPESFVMKMVWKRIQDRL